MSGKGKSKQLGAMEAESLPVDQCLYFRNELRTAREQAYADAEDYDAVIHVIERLGSLLTEGQRDLGRYESAVCAIASKSVLMSEVADRWPDMHPPFRKLYDLIRKGRNSAMHVGARARSLTHDVTRASLVLEDALMIHADRLQHFMVEDVVRAELWQPLSFLRQRMLMSSFSFLPVKIHGRWMFVADFVLAKYLRSACAHGDRGKRMIESLGSAVESKHISLLRATICRPDDPPQTMFKGVSTRPVLVCQEGDPERLLGIVSPFDLL